ncbi:D-alanyl-D-alanine carboxypeptidase family protein [Roseibacillus ishigakijimensis]|uniref:D-alanyl-D-alanine carboxypeptidase n=1 Tax=Roseibacillus ishigakijimensis TaxID=454146 RepID=A0A934RSC4_9BACT|nr:D-alanyl-D-alanine carboxypeptidase family protein [Roseibacillus ishigakijimensis]MBK1834761.1 D-alanyl-D-alanine carboxypeptidase [Roseibacillus ishigakijimensis]
MRRFFLGLGWLSLMVCSSCAPVPANYPAASSSALPAPTPRPANPMLAPVAETPRDLLPGKPVPAISAPAALVMDGVTGRILAAKNADERRAVASTQKLLTALVVMEDGPLSDPVTVASSDTMVEPSKIYIRSGETYTRAQLMKALMVKSGNDVAKALARDVAGSEAAFMARMNAKAASLGMRNSFFKNPHGLTEPGQYSTARDVAILARAAYQYPAIRDYVRTKSYTFTRPGGGSKSLSNTNKLLTRVSYCTGMKTGTTNASGRCLVSSGELNGRFCIVVVLGATNTTNLYNDSEALLRWSLERSE